MRKDEGQDGLQGGWDMEAVADGKCRRGEKGMEGIQGMKAMAAKHERREKNEMRGTWGKIAGIPVIAGIPWRGEVGFA